MCITAVGGKRQGDQQAAADVAIEVEALHLGCFVAIGPVVHRLGGLTESGGVAAGGRIVTFQGENHLVAHPEGAIEADAHLLLPHGGGSHPLLHHGRHHGDTGPVVAGRSQLHVEAAAGVGADKLKRPGAAGHGRHGHKGPLTAGEPRGGIELGQQSGTDEVQGIESSAGLVVGADDIGIDNGVADCLGTGGPGRGEGQRDHIPCRKRAGQGHPVALAQLNLAGLVHHHRHRL